MVFIVAAAAVVFLSKTSPRLLHLLPSKRTCLSLPQEAEEEKIKSRRRRRRGGGGEEKTKVEETMDEEETKVEERMDEERRK